MPLIRHPTGAGSSGEIKSVKNVPKKSGLSAKSKMVARSIPKAILPCPKSRRVGNDEDYSDDAGSEEHNTLEEDQAEINRMELAAKRYNQRSDVARLGQELQVHLRDVRGSEDFDDEDDNIMGGNLSIRQENTRLRVLCRRLTLALRFEQRRADLTRSLMTELNQEYLGLNPESYVVGNLEHYYYLNERIKLEEWMRMGTVPGGFKSKYGWDREWDQPFSASYHTPYLAMRNGRFPVRPNRKYAAFGLGFTFEEFNATEVSSLYILNLFECWLTSHPFFFLLMFPGRHPER
jgi:hypothetical protein